MSDTTAPRVSLFVTCLADLMRPSVAFASIRLLEQAGCIVDVPLEQTCCGQPGYNSGEFEATIPVAQQTIARFEHAEYVVAPSGSCAGMIREHYPRLLTGEWAERARALAEKTYELTTFLNDVVKLQSAPAVTTELPTITYHDSCAGLRELGIKQQPRELLQRLCDVEVTEMQQTDVCCGFGGTFCAKMPDISEKMVDDKLRHAAETGATLLTGGDLGCLLNIAGRARRRGLDLEVRHVAELLSGDLYSPAIGEGE
ncbi:(Fe-S)-binding protein [Pseudohalioglobus sediminis]|uniref:(Fe-S)-binding protein n=1 Tax=Pseudohalioglobus sediminis TaxID=2606449 RepID=A0A5B0WZI1_9GAMM|nr:(Fe-S)-binding protein [Pseudohalioglobus sediminis]KAA1192462.1 (Fe-S)-binding protein [Pseudohalioglobus sediminis]